MKKYFLTLPKKKNAFEVQRYVLHLYYYIISVIYLCRYIVAKAEVFLKINKTLIVKFVINPDFIIIYRDHLQYNLNII